MKPYLDYLLENGAAKHEKVKWGKSYRKIIFIGGKRYQYKGGDNFNKNLNNKFVSLYISMSENLQIVNQKLLKIMPPQRLSAHSISALSSRLTKSM